MRLLTLNGKLINKNVSKYRVDWNKPCRSIIQFKVKQFLRQFWEGQIVFEEFPCVGTKLRLDLFNATLGIVLEINGRQHESYNKFFCQNDPNKYLKGYKNDILKAQWIEKNGFTLVEINYDEIDKLSKEFFKEKFNIIL